MARGSFHEDWNDLLTRFAHRREHERLRAEQLQRAQEEATAEGDCRSFRLNQALFERAHPKSEPSNPREFLKSSSRY